MRISVANEITGRIYGEGDVLKLSVTNTPGFTGFDIRGTALLKAERIGIGCQGGDSTVDAVFTRIAE